MARQDRADEQNNAGLFVKVLAQMREGEGESQRLQGAIEGFQRRLTEGEVDVGVADLVAKLEDFADGEILLEGGGRLLEARESEEDVAWKMDFINARMKTTWT